MPDALGGLLAPQPRTPPDPDRLQTLTPQKYNLPPDSDPTGFLADASDGEDKSRAHSIVSAISDTYVFPLDDSRGPVSPLLPPPSNIPPGGTFYTSPSSIVSDLAPSPGATIRAVAPTAKDLTAEEYNYGSSQPIGLNFQDMPWAARHRPWLKSTSSHEHEKTSSEGEVMPLEIRSSPRAQIATTPTQEPDRKDSVPIVEVNGNEVRPSVDIARQLDTVVSDEFSAEDTERARKIYDGEEDFVSKHAAAAWLGERSQTSSRTLSAYMGFYNWSGQNILSAMRGLCERLTLKGESQQVDRILEAFAGRWHECNPNNGFKGPGKLRMWSENAM